MRTPGLAPASCKYNENNSVIELASDNCPQTLSRSFQSLRYDRRYRSYLTSKDSENLFHPSIFRNLKARTGKACPLTTCSENGQRSITRPRDFINVIPENLYLPAPFLSLPYLPRRVRTFETHQRDNSIVSRVFSSSRISLSSPGTR